MKILLLIVALVIIGGLVAVGAKSFNSNNNQQTKAKESISHQAKASTASQTASTQLPPPPINCSTSANLIPLTSDYTITGMDCVAAGSSNVVLICNGSILQAGTNVTVDCSTPANTVVGNGAYCSGKANASASPGNLALNYSCYNSNQLSSSSVYSCSGDIAGYSTFGINLPLSVACGS